MVPSKYATTVDDYLLDADVAACGIGEIAGAADALKDLTVVADPVSKLAGRLGDVGDKSPLGHAVARVLAGARSEGDRRRFATCLGTFLRWCDGRGIPPSECWPGDLAAFKRDRLALGYRSHGEYGRVARRLLDELTPGR